MLDRKMYWVLWCFGKFTTKQNTYLILHDFNAVEMIFFYYDSLYFFEKGQSMQRITHERRKIFFKEKGKLLF